MYVQQLLESANEVAEGYKSIAKKHVEVDYDVNPLISTRRYHGGKDYSLDLTRNNTQLLINKI